MTTKIKEIRELKAQPDNGTLTAAEARRVLADEQRRKVEACKAEVQAVFDKHGCGLRAVPFITQDGRLAATVEIVPLAEG